MSSLGSAVDPSDRTIIRASLVVLGTLLTISLLAGVAAADGHGNYVIEQDGETHTIGSIVDNETSAEDFYDYRSPYTEPSAWTYSSYGTTEYQQDNTSILLLYEGPEGTSLVVVHEKYHENRSAGTTGGSASFEVSGLPADGDWVVEDDDYDNQTDVFNHGETQSELHWIWATGRTDGAVFTGVEPDSEITIDPRFNEDAELQSDDPRENGTVDEWQLIDATDDGFERVSLSSIEDPITIRTEPRASLRSTTEQPLVNESVTFDAGDSDPEDGIVEYRWDFNGDGEIDEVSEGASGTHTFEEAGEYDVTVTVADGAGNTDNATTSVSVLSSPPPEATINATDSATVDEPIVLDAADSDLGEEPSEFTWRIDGEAVATTTVPTYEMSFSEAATYELSVTVTDSAGREDTATTSIEIVDGLRAVPAVSPNPIVEGDTVEFDGTNSTGNVSRYEWSFGDGANATGARVNHTYETAGTYEATLTVTDPDGQTNSNTTAVEVASREPTAALSAPETATVNESVTLNASESTGITGNVSYEWRIDGELVETTSEPTYQMSFDDAETYDMSVTVNDSTNREDTANTSISVTRGLQALPIASETSVTEGESVTLDGTNSTGNVSRYEWSFGDGANATGARVNHSYDTAGEYNATLTVVGANGGDSSNATAVEVTSRGPNASLSVPDEVTVNESVALDASGSTGITGNVSYEWRIDGEVVEMTTEPTTTATFGDPGPVEITVTVIDETNRTSTDTASVSVRSPTEARLEANTTSVTVGESIGFDASNSSTSNLTYAWSFGDGANATGAQVGHAYGEPGEYTVELTVRDANGATDTAATNVTVAESDDRSDDDNSGSSGGGGGSGPVGGGGSGGGGGGSSGGSSGGGGSSVSSPSEITADVTEDDPGVVRLTAADVEPGVPVSAEIGLGDRVRLDSVTLETDDSHDDFTATIDRPHRQAPPGLPPEHGAVFGVDTTASISSIDYELSLSDETIETAGIDAENLTVYRFDGEWVAVETTVEEDGDRYLVEVSADGGGTIGVGSSENLAPADSAEAAPDIDLVEVRVEDDRIQAGDSVTMTGVFENDGTASGEHRAELLVEGSTAGTETVTVEANETSTVTFTQRFESPGTFEIGIDDRTESVRVSEGTDNSSAEPTVTAEDSGSDTGLALVFMIGGLGSVIALGLAVVSRVRGRTLR